MNFITVLNIIILSHNTHTAHWSALNYTHADIKCSGAYADKKQHGINCQKVERETYLQRF